jgi:hypothetical protein
MRQGLILRCQLSSSTMSSSSTTLSGIWHDMLNMYE